MTSRDTTTAAQLVTLTVNGRTHPLAIEPRRSLLDALRRDVGLTGTKEVCAMGNCGACTVLVDDAPVYSCLVLAVESEGQSIETVEGLSDGQDLAPLQQAFVDCDALQCGFCTPGQIMSLEGLRRRDPDPDDAAIEHALVGNLCRCGAYRHILEAARSGLNGA